VEDLAMTAKECVRFVLEDQFANKRVENRSKIVSTLLDLFNDDTPSVDERFGRRKVIEIECTAIAIFWKRNKAQKAGQKLIALATLVNTWR